MFRATILTVALAFPAAALACGGDKGEMANKVDTPQVELAAVQIDATKCAKTADLVGSNCKFSTGQMAQRVHTDGKDTTLTAQLVQHADKLESHVAAPFKIDDHYVIANEVIDGLDDRSANIAFEGKVLEVDGVKYFLVTGFEKAST